MNTTDTIETVEIISLRQDADALQVHADNMTLADELGRIKAEVSRLQKVERRIKAELIDRGVTEIDGHDYRVTVTEVTKKMVDTGLVKKLVPAMLLANIMKTVVSTTVRCNALRTTH